MKNYLLIVGLSFIFYNSPGQSGNNDLSKVSTISQAEDFIARNPKANGKIFTINSGTDNSEITNPLFNKKSGFLFKIDNNYFKILQVDSSLSFRVRYIYLSGEELAKSQIDSIRNLIISKYKSGVSFDELVQSYSMDGNVSGDTGWFTEGMMVPEFEMAVKGHKKDDIFIVDIPDRKWYHIVLKTFKDTYIKEITIMKTN